MNKSKFIQVTYLSGTKGYIRADIIVELYESRGVTYVYKINNNDPFRVKEHVDEIIAKIESEPTIDEIRAKIEKLKAKIPKETMYGSSQIDGINMVLKHIFDEYKTKSEDKK